MTLMPLMVCLAVSIIGNVAAIYALWKARLAIQLYINMTREKIQELCIQHIDMAVELNKYQRAYAVLVEMLYSKANASASTIDVTKN